MKLQIESVLYIGAMEKFPKQWVGVFQSGLVMEEYRNRLQFVMELGVWEHFWVGNLLLLNRFGKEFVKFFEDTGIKDFWMGVVCLDKTRPGKRRVQTQVCSELNWG